MTGKTLASLRRQLEKERAAIARHRDRLRELQSDVEDLGDSAADAADSLDHAIDALSRLA